MYGMLLPSTQLLRCSDVFWSCSATQQGHSKNHDFDCHWGDNIDDPKYCGKDIKNKFATGSCTCTSGFHGPLCRCNATQLADFSAGSNDGCKGKLLVQLWHGCSFIPDSPPSVAEVHPSETQQGLLQSHLCSTVTCLHYTMPGLLEVPCLGFHRHTCLHLQATDSLLSVHLPDVVLRSDTSCYRIW